MEANLKHTTEVKKNLINLLMYNLYGNEKNLFREYVQNSTDSIVNAVNSGVLQTMQDGRVNIVIDANNQTIVIRDNGTGINSSEAVARLLDVSSSRKDGVNQAGQFGIGRLVGGGYCRKLVFITTAKGNENGVRVEFDNDNIYQMVKVDKQDYSTSEVFDACTTKSSFSADVDDHYFEVRLEGVRDEYKEMLLDVAGVTSYLSDVAPVNYSDEFLNAFVAPLAKENPWTYNKFKNLKVINLFVNGCEVRKKYGTEVSGTGDKIDRIYCFAIRDEVFGEMGWGLIGITRYTKLIPAEDSASQIRLRLHNIQIGSNDTLTSKVYWSEVRNNSYFYGEVHIEHPDVQPTADRNDIFQNVASKAFVNALRECFSDINKLWRTANAIVSCKKSIEDGLKRLETVNDFQTRNMIETNGFNKWNSYRKSVSLPLKYMVALYEEDYEELMAKFDELKKKILDGDVSTPVVARPATASSIFGVGATGVSAKQHKPVVNTVNTLPSATTAPAIATAPAAVEQPAEENVTPLNHSDITENVVIIQPKDQSRMSSILLADVEKSVVDKVLGIIDATLPSNENTIKKILVDEIKSRFNIK